MERALASAEAVGRLVRSALRRRGMAWLALIESARSGLSGGSCMAGPEPAHAVPMPFGLLPLLRPCEGEQMCFFGARLAAEDWWHVVHVLTSDSQVEAHV